MRSVPKSSSMLRKSGRLIDGADQDDVARAMRGEQLRDAAELAPVHHFMRERLEALVRLAFDADDEIPAPGRSRGGGDMHRHRAACRR